MTEHFHFAPFARRSRGRRAPSSWTRPRFRASPGRKFPGCLRRTPRREAKFSPDGFFSRRGCERLVVLFFSRGSRVRFLPPLAEVNVVDFPFGGLKGIHHYWKCPRRGFRALPAALLRAHAQMHGKRPPLPNLRSPKNTICLLYVRFPG